MKRIVVLLCISFVCINISIAQSWQWGRRGGGGCGLSCNRDEDIKDLKCDANGNIYFLARLDGGGDENLQTGNGDSADIGTIKGGVPGALLASYNSCGKLRWKKVFYAPNAEVNAFGLSMDTLGHINVIVSSDANFHCDIDSVSSSKRKFLSIVQYDTSGKFKWLRQPTPDTASVINSAKFFPISIETMPDGDIYAFCYLGKGLISGSSNLVATTTRDLYILKYSTTGVPKELIKLDIDINGSDFDRINFRVTQSRKFIFNMAKTYGTGYTATSPLVGGQPANHRLFLCCFNQNGSLAWKFTNSDTTGALFGRPNIDETTGMIYSAGGVKGNGIPDTIGGTALTNPYSTGQLPILLCVDTTGNFKWVNWGYCKSNTYNFLKAVAKGSNGKIYAVGEGGGIVWGGFQFINPSGSGAHIYLNSFNATTGAIQSMDSLKGNSYTGVDVITSDKNDNIYIGGRIYSDITVAGQTLQSYGGLNDFFIAKYGSDCSLMPLKIISYDLLTNKDESIINQWQTANETNVKLFNIERSFDGNIFESVGTIVAQNKLKNIYTFSDNIQHILNPSQVFYYRIESLDNDGYKYYSSVKKLVIESNDEFFSVYPNPVADNLFIRNQKFTSNGEAVILDICGIPKLKVVLDKQLNKISLRGLSKGYYLLQLIDKNGIRKVKKIIKE